MLLDLEAFSDRSKIRVQITAMQAEKDELGRSVWMIFKICEIVNPITHFGELFTASWSTIGKAKRFLSKKQNKITPEPFAEDWPSTISLSVS